MEKKYVIKQCMYSMYLTDYLEWNISIGNAEQFDTIEEAEQIIKRQEGIFQIETIYIVN